MSAPWGIIRKLPVGVEGFSIPIDVFVSGATSYDVLAQRTWLIQAHAEISFAKSEMTYRIDPQFMGRVPITLLHQERKEPHPILRFSRHRGDRRGDLWTPRRQPRRPLDPEETAGEPMDPEENRRGDLGP
jgi:hypothetical protein